MNWYKINTSRHNYKIYIENLIKYNFEEGIGDQHLRVSVFLEWHQAWQISGVLWNSVQFLGLS